VLADPRNEGNVDELNLALKSIVIEGI